MKNLKKSLIAFLLYSILLGGVYPLVITLLGNIVAPSAIAGSMVTEKGSPIGSELIGELFTSNEFFWGRPSATTPNPYNALSSSGSNLALSNPQFLTDVTHRAQTIGASKDKKVPIDLVTTSASGLDPHISVESALFQIKRVSEFSGISEEKLKGFIHESTSPRFLGIFGEPGVNVLLLNKKVMENKK